MSHSDSQNLLGALRELDTCAVANAIECLDVRLRNEGFANETQLHCRFPDFAPMVGYAVTLRVRSANPPVEGGSYVERTDWWSVLDALPSPHVLVIEDVDRRPGVGAFVGEVHAAMLQAMGCVGVVTNGAVRDLPAVERSGLQLFSGTVSPSHAYVHVVEYGGPVEIAGLQIRPGDLLHGDQHGVVRIPEKVAQAVPAMAQRIHARERDIIALCRSGHFSHEKLRDLMSKSRC